MQLLLFWEKINFSLHFQLNSHLPVFLSVPYVSPVWNVYLFFSLSIIVQQVQFLAHCFYHSTVLTHSLL